MVGKLAPNSSHLTRGLVKYVPSRDYFRAVSSQNGDEFVTSPPPRIAELVLRQSRLLLAISGSILLRKTAIPPVAIPHRKTVVPSKANPLFASVLAISGSVVLRKTAIPSVATPHRKTVVPSKANPLFASANAISRSIVLRKTVIPSEAISHRKMEVRSNANPLLASANPDLARIKRKIIQRGESE